MNHLSGLAVPDPTSDLGPDEASALSKFRSAHEASRPAPNGEGKGQPQPPPQQQQPDGEPTYSVPTASLPPCGWRPLDDATLYRFLCADRLGDGTFQPIKSAERLRDALRYRREGAVDDIFAEVGEEEEEERGGRDDPSEASAYSPPPGPAALSSSSSSSAASPPSSSFLRRSDSIASATSIASGTLTRWDEVLVDEPMFPPCPAVPPPEKEMSGCEDPAPPPPPPPSSSTTKLTPDDLERYRRLRVRVFVGRDHNGRPVMFERLGEFLGSGNVRHFTTDQWIRLYVWDLERHFTEMRNAAQKSGRPVMRYVYFGDASGIVTAIVNRSIWKVVPLLRELVGAVERHYPEIVDRVVLFNVPRIASALYAAVKVFLDPVTADKVELHPGVPLGTFRGLVDEGVVPAEYGGSNGVPYPRTARE